MRATFAALTLIALSTLTAVAQTSATAPGTLAVRSERQQQRIAAGVRSGALTPRETARLEEREARIANEAKTMRVANHGSLTARERRVLNRQQNRLSQAIARAKHNERVRQG